LATPPISLPAEIAGPRVLLRPYQLADATELWQAVNESRQSLLPWMTWVSTYQSEADADLYVARALAQWLLRKEMALGIFDRRSSRYLGGSGLHGPQWELRSFEIGYWLRTSAEGQGYATEAVKVLTRFAFDELQANRVQIRVNPRNERSCRVARRCGYRHEGTLRNAFLGPHSQPMDVHMFALTPDDYQALAWASPNEIS
jgi:ribosomal-protein-serine acetyltransferase